MRFVIIDTYYSQVLDWLYAKNQVSKLPYQDQLEFVYRAAWGTSDFYSRNLKLLGHWAIDVIVNNLVLQKQWVRENGSLLLQAKTRFRFDDQRVVWEQICQFRPDVVYIQSVFHYPPEFLEKIQKKYFLVGQISYPMIKDPWGHLQKFNLLLSSFPHYVINFRRRHLPVYYFRIAFEPTLLARVKPRPRQYDVTFVGGFSAHHVNTYETLEYLAKNVPLDVWGYGINQLPETSSVRQHYHGTAFGIEMYKVYACSKITINRHGAIAKNFANNMRLYEATGMGTLLLTEQKKNLPELFVPDKEVVTYASKEELLNKTRYYLAHSREREKIARAGQKRTLTDHTYLHRMKELLEILAKYV